uniref:Solute carrier family 30 member 6 n=1 Tax=Oryzias sinensis TaxID=183150 RepID=A0A8C7YPN1_9TELE
MAMDAMMSTSTGLSYSNVGEFYPRKFGPKPDVVPSWVTERKVGPLDKPDMVSVDVLNLQNPDVPIHRKKQEHDTYVLGTFHPFRKSNRSVVGKFLQEVRLVASDRRSWRILLFGALNLLCTGCLLMWCSSTNSMALTAYTYLTIFDLFSLITCLVSSWVTMKKPSQFYSFGFERLEVLAVFASTVLIQLGALFILKESVERFMEQPEVHTGRLLVGTFVALFFNLSTLMSVRNKPFAYVSEAASSSWLQEHVADLSRSNFHAVDTASAVAIALMTFGTMYPMSVYSGKVLLQTTPSHVIGQLDKLLREISTLDGVLELRNEHFWTVGFGSLAGSAHVRIRRDANEQLVLAHVTNRLLPLVSTLTVQIFKDDWTRPLLTSALTSPAVAHPHAEGYAASSLMPPALPGGELDPMTSTPTKLSGPPPEFSFNTPGRNVPPVLFAAAGPHSHRPYGNLGLAYGAVPYSGMPSQGFMRPGAGLGLGVPGIGSGFGLSHSYGTDFSGSRAPLRFGANNPLGPQTQYRQHQP